MLGFGILFRTGAGNMNLPLALKFVIFQKDKRSHEIYGSYFTYTPIINMRCFCSAPVTKGEKVSSFMADLRRTIVSYLFAFISSFSGKDQTSLEIITSHIKGTVSDYSKVTVDYSDTQHSLVSHIQLFVGSFKTQLHQQY